MSNWWDFNKQRNEAGYGEWCGHRDRMIFREDEKGPWLVECRTCRVRVDWNGGHYQLPERRLPNKGTNHE